MYFGSGVYVKTKIKEALIFVGIVLAVASLPAAVYFGLSRGGPVVDAVEVQCGIATPNGIAPTIHVSRAVGVTVSEFGVIRTNDFIYTPASGELCIFVPIGD